MPGFPSNPAVTAPAVRNDAPAPDDWGVVARVLGSVVIVGPVDQVRSATATHTVVAGTTVSTTLLASNASRRGAFFYNNSNRFLFLKLGTGALTTSFTVKIGPGGFYEIQWPTYTGLVTGIWPAGVVGNCQITELT